MKKCTKAGKVCYKTANIAEIELAFCRMAYNNGNDTYRQIRKYKCEHCGYWHLTSKE